MKNIILIAVLLLSVNNLTQADMLGSTKDSVAVADSSEVEILTFSNSEITRIIKDSKSLNPQIEDLGIIRTVDTVILRINDSTMYSFTPLTGESCWLKLQKGIDPRDLLPFAKNLMGNVTAGRSSVSDSIFLDRVDSIYGDIIIFETDSNLAEKKFLVSTDSNSTEKKSLVTKDSNQSKKVAVQPRRTTKRFLPVETESMSILDSLKNEANKTIDSMKRKDGYSEDTIYVRKNNLAGGDNQDYFPNKQNEKNILLDILWIIIGLSVIIFFILVFRKPKNKTRRKKIVNEGFGYFNDEPNPDWNNKGGMSQLE